MRPSCLFQRAIDSGHGVAGPVAAYNLGLIPMDRGERLGAEVALRRVIASGNRDLKARAEKALRKLAETARGRLAAVPCSIRLLPVRHLGCLLSAASYGTALVRTAVSERQPQLIEFAVVAPAR